MSTDTPQVTHQDLDRVQASLQAAQQMLFECHQTLMELQAQVPSSRQEQKDATELRCSFCGKKRDDVANLIAGPGVYICTECVDLCNQIIAQTQVPMGE